MIGGRRPISGRKVGDKRIRVERVHSPTSATRVAGQLTAKAAASAPTTGVGRVTGRIKLFLLGRPLANIEEIGERLSKKKALAIFSSDAISSSAYATEEIILAFLLAGVGGAVFALSLQVSIAIADPARHRRLQLPPGLHRLSRPAAARTRCPRRTSGGSRRSSPPRRC